MKLTNFLTLGAAATLANPLIQYMVLDEMLDSSDSSDSMLKLMLLSPGLLGKFTLHHLNQMELRTDLDILLQVKTPLKLAK